MRAIWEFQRPTVRDGSGRRRLDHRRQHALPVIGYLHSVNFSERPCSAPPSHNARRAEGAKRPRDLEAKAPLVVAVVHPDPRKPQRAALVEPARQRAGGDVAGATRGLDHAVVVVAVRTRSTRTGVHALLAFTLRGLELHWKLFVGDPRQARMRDACGSRSPSRLPRAVRLLPGHGHELALVRPGHPLSMPGHDIGASLPANRSRHEDRARKAELRQDRERKLDHRAVGVVERHQHLAPPGRVTASVNVAPSYPRPRAARAGRSNRSGVIDRSAGQLGLTAW